MIACHHCGKTRSDVKADWEKQFWFGRRPFHQAYCCDVDDAIFTRFSCPECGRWEVDVEMRSWAQLVQDPYEPDAMHMEPNGSLNKEYEWDSMSLARCRNCDFLGQVRHFDRMEFPRPIKGSRHEAVVCKS